MSIELICKNCKAELEAEDDMIGIELSCPNCDSPIVVRRPLDLKENKVKNAYRCPNCNKEIQTGAIICVECGYNIQEGRPLNSHSDEQSNESRIKSIKWKDIKTFTICFLISVFVMIGIMIVNSQFNMFDNIKEKSDLFDILKATLFHSKPTIISLYQQFFIFFICLLILMINYAVSKTIEKINSNQSIHKTQDNMKMCGCMILALKFWVLSAAIGTIIIPLLMLIDICRMLFR